MFNPPLPWLLGILTSIVLPLPACAETVRKVLPTGAVQYEFQQSGDEDTRTRILAEMAATDGPPSIDDEQILISLLLAGDPGHADERALAALYWEAQRSRQAIVIFLGDLIYPRGLPAHNHPIRDKAMRKLETLLDYAGPARSKTYFLPGNHDWGDMDESGLASILRIEQFLNSYFKEQRWYPRSACPGPARLPSPAPLRLVALDTQWWLHPYEKPSLEHCAAGTTLESRMQSFVTAKDEQSTVLLTHHPFLVYGSHRGDGTNPHCLQDLLCPAYQRMLHEIEAAFGNARPLVCAAGHAHSLQILKPERGCQYVIISGAMSKPTHTEYGPQSLIAKRTLGFIRLDVLRDGRMFATALEATERGHARPFFSLWLKPRSKEAPSPTPRPTTAD